MARAASCVALLSSVFLVVSGIVAAGEPVAVDVASAVAAFDQRTHEPIVTFMMTESSRRVFADLTARNVGKPMEIRVDGKVIMKPVIREPILGGSGQLSGGFSIDAARDLAARLSSGAARIEVEVVQN